MSDFYAAERSLSTTLAGEARLSATPPDPALIGLIGKKRSGKDTFARGLIERGFERFAFADNLKASVLAVDPIVFGTAYDEYGEVDYTRLSEVVERYGWEEAKEDPEVRRLLQTYGVAIRELDSEFWVRTVMQRVVRTPRAVITDVRFPNEAHAVEAEGGKVVRIVRPGLVSTDEHISETALDDYPADLTIENTGTADDLVALARRLAL